MAYINGKKILFGAPMTVVPGSGSSESYDKGYKDGQIALLEDSEYMKGTERGTNSIAINDVSPVVHDLGVTVKPIKYTTDKTALPLATTGTNNGINFAQEGDTVVLNGKANNVSYIPLTLPTTLENGRTYYVGLIYIEGTPEQYPINCAFMVYNPTTYYYEQKHEIVYGQTSYDAVVLAFENLTIDYTGCRVIPIISTEYVGVGCECTESVENILVKRYGKNLCPKSSITTAEHLHGQIDIKATDLGYLPSGTYTASCDITRYPDDDVTNPRLSLFIYYTDGTNENATLYSNNVPNDGITRKYIVTKTSNASKEIDYIRFRPFQFSSPYTTRNAKAENSQIELQLNTSLIVCKRYKLTQTELLEV